jgi:hypothetical protein
MNHRFVYSAWLAMLIGMGANAHGPDSHSMGGPAEIVTAPNGALINKNALKGLTAWAMTLPPNRCGWPTASGSSSAEA